MKIRRRNRSMTGMTSLEAALMGLLCFVFAAFSCCLLMLFWGYSFNDEACRDAARTAAASNDEATAYRMVQAALAAHRADGTFVSDPICDRFTHPSDFVFSKDPETGPFVQVTTRCQISTPFSIGFFGKPFRPGKVDCARSYLFPLLAANYDPQKIVQPRPRPTPPPTSQPPPPPQEPEPEPEAGDQEEPSGPPADPGPNDLVNTNPGEPYVPPPPPPAQPNPEPAPPPPAGEDPPDEGGGEEAPVDTGPPDPDPPSGNIDG